MSKFIKNSNEKRNITYIECECGEHILKVEKLNTSDEIILSCIGDYNSFTLYGLKDINDFYKKCVQIQEGKFKYICKINDYYTLNVHYDTDIDLYSLQPHNILRAPIPD